MTAPTKATWDGAIAAPDQALIERGPDRRAIPQSALELADLQAMLTVLAARAGESAAMLVGTDEFRRQSGRIEAFSEVAVLIAQRVKALTGGLS